MASGADCDQSPIAVRAADGEGGGDVAAIPPPAAGRRLHAVACSRPERHGQGRRRGQRGPRQRSLRSRCELGVAPARARRRDQRRVQSPPPPPWRGLIEQHLDLGVLASLEQEPASRRVSARGFERVSAQARHHPTPSLDRVLLGGDDGPGVGQVVVDRVRSGPDGELRALASGDLQHGCTDAETSSGIGQSLVVAEHDDLMGLARLEPDTARRPGWRPSPGPGHRSRGSGTGSGEASPWKEQRERGAVQLTLRHHRQRRSRHVVDRHRQLDTAAGPRCPPG